MSSSLLKIVLPIFAILIGLGGAAYMMANKITPERIDSQELAEPVTVSEIWHTSEQVVITASGTVTAAQQVQIRPEVSGKIVAISNRLIPGGRFRSGEVIARIDERDYQVRLTAQHEVVASARLRLRQEQARQAVARQEWDLLEDSIPADKENRDLALRIPQIEQAEAALAAAQAALTKAELDLERCTITSPFSSLVMRESVDLGQLISPQTEVATIIGTDAYWVQVSLPVADLTWIELPSRRQNHGASAEVVYGAGELEIVRQGYVQRLLGDVDPAGRLARLLIVVENPLGLGDAAEAGAPLLIGAYVTVRIAGRTVDNVVKVPRRALREVTVDGANGTREGLWIMNQDDRLQTCVAEVIWRNADSVLVRNGFSDGERIVTSSIPTPIEGMKLVVQSDR
jgi:RND family efflux transporter MFP subunit